MSKSPGSVYTAFAALYFPVTVRFAVVVVEPDKTAGWREGTEDIVVDGVGLTGAETADPPPGGLDKQSTVLVVDSLGRRVNLVGS